MSTRFSRATRSAARLTELFVAVRSIKNWGGLIRRFISSSGEYPFTIETRRGSKITAEDWWDVTTVWAIYCRREYAVPLNARLIADFGANIGVFAIYAAEQATAAKVVCFEPFPDTFSRLERHVLANGFSDRIACIKAAVAGATGEIRMAETADTSCVRSILKEPAEGASVLYAHAFSFASAIARVMTDGGTDRIDLMKIDVEGSEHDFIPNADPDTMISLDRLQMEYHPNGPFSAIKESCRHSGMSIQRNSVYSENFGIVHFAR